MSETLVKPETITFFAEEPTSGPQGEPVIYELGVPLRDELRLPEVNELEVVRHFVRMSQRNHAIDVGFYPLGSCTMKYNPKINEEVVRYPGISECHPLQPGDQVQGALELLYRLERLLCEIGGMDRASLQPAA